MPPKRKRGAMNAAPSDSEGTPNSQDTSSVPQTPAVDTPLSATPASADPASQPSAPKKAKIVDDEDSQPVVSTKPAPEEEGPDDSVDDGREVCRYDGNCYRKNPQHFQEFRHPKQRSKGATSSPKPAAATSSRPPLVKKRSSIGELADEVKKARIALQSVSNAVEFYKSFMRATLGDKHKITSDEKKTLKRLRAEHAITEAEHDQCLGQFGWTPDEYEDGEKKSDDFELVEEKDIYKHDTGFKIFTLNSGQKRSKEQEAVWSSVATRFYQTMSKAQGNYSIKSIGVVANSTLRASYLKKKEQLHQKDPKHNQEEWGFHGTTASSIEAIAKEGFKHPDDLKPKDTKGQKKGAKAKKAAAKVELLDDGYFGKGIYFSMFSDYAMWYSEERESNQILLSKILTGKVYKCTGRMDGADRQPGHDAHYSPKGNEIIVFEGCQVLPRYVITFEERDAEEREQEVRRFETNLPS